MSRQFSFISTGEAFRPSVTALPFAEAIDAGAIGTKGIHRGQPMPYGWARLDAASENDGHDALMALVATAASAKPILVAAGATDFVLWVTRSYREQCNEELSAEDLQAIASLGCALCYSAYLESTDGA